MMFRFDSKSVVEVGRTSVVRGILASALLLLVASSGSTATIAHWRFEPGDLTADSSGNGNVLTNAGVTSSGDISSLAQGSGSAEFDGSHTAFSTTSSLDLSGETQLTFEWFAKTSQASLSLLFEHTDDQNANPGAFTGQLNPAYGVASSVGFTNPVSDGFYRDEMPAVPGGLDIWHHYAVQFDGTVNNAGANDRIKMFVDGVFVSTDDDSGGPTSTTPGFLDDILYIGSRDDASFKYIGLLDEFRISSGLLSPSEFLNVPPVVPEPSTGLLALVGLVCLNARRRKNRRR